MGIEILGGVLLLVVVTTIVMLHRAKTVTTREAETPPDAALLTPPISLANDPLGAGMADRALFEAWASRFDNTLYLDGELFSLGFNPPVYFVTKRDGRIVLS